MIKTLIVSDLDGTLSNEHHEIDPANVKAISEFTSLGGLFTLATGRMEKSVLPYIEQLDINIPVILYNGAKIYDPVTKTTLYEKNLAVPRDVWGIINEFIFQNVGVLVYQNSEVMCANRNVVIEEYEKKEKIRCGNLLKETYDQPITKILIISPSVELLKTIEQRILAYDWGCETLYSETNYLEILPKGASKGDALRRLVQHFPNKKITTVAVGDNLNDVSLLTQANIGYAVENANPLLKEVADKITVHHTSHAIVHIINDIMAGKALKSLVKGETYD